MSTLLVIFAHPDDESHGPGGTLAKYAAEGVNVHYVCATRGEAGNLDSRFLQGGARPADVRTAELRRAAAELGIGRVHFLGYRDSGMPGSPDNAHPDSLYSAPLDEVAERISKFICHLRPDAVITHDQYGWYGHPDHIKCYEATLRAYELLFGIRVGAGTGADGHVKAPRLYAATFPKRGFKIMVRLMPLFGRDPRRYGQNQDVDLVEIASWDVPVTAKIAVGAHLPAKDRAIARHASQQPLAQSKNPLVSALLRRMQSVEYFNRLYPAVRAGEGVERSLFDAAPKPAWKLATNEMPTLA